MGNGSATVGTPRSVGAPAGELVAGNDSFAVRADRVAERLQRLQRLPISA
jgi:hypothetical protein